jgi:hypothetical protein
MQQVIGALALSILSMVGLSMVGPSMVGSRVAEEPSGGRQDVTTVAEVGRFLAELATEVAGADGQWTVLYRGTRVVVHATDQHGRMRAMAPVASAADQSEAELRILLEANYARALDAKFAIGDGVVWSLFNRPLRGLDRESLRDGLEQVVTLKENFGSSYRSTDLTFGTPPG